MSARLLHVSDLHTGKHDDVDVQRELGVLVERLRPDVLVASGDLTHRGRREQHERAHRFLTSLGVPVVAVPGNHDMPYTFPARFTRTWAEFERVWGTAEPTHASEALHVVGLNSARPLRQQGGGLREEQLRGAAARLGAAPAGAFRVVVLHHHLTGAPWRAARKRPVSRRGRVLRELAAAGADLILSGHIHQAAVGERHEFEVLSAATRPTVVAVAPGLGRPRPSLEGEPRGLQVYEVGDAALEVETYLWRDGAWAPVARRAFAR